MKLMFYMLVNMKVLQFDSIIFDGFGQVYPKYPDKNLQYFYDIL